MLSLDELKNQILNKVLSQSTTPGSIGGSAGGFLANKLGQKAGLNPVVQPLTNFAGSTLGNIATQKVGQFAGQQLANHMAGNIVGNLSSPLVSSAAGSLTGGAGATAAGAGAAAGAAGAAGASGAGSLLGASALGGPIGLAIGAGLAGLSMLFNANEQKKQNRQMAQQITQQAEQEVNADLDEQRNRLNFSNPYIASNNNIQSDVQPNYGQLLESTLSAFQPQQVQQPQVQDNAWGSLDNEILNSVYGGRDYSKLYPDTQTESQGLKDKILSAVGDLKGGYNENVNNMPELNPSESKMYKIGEALGTASRVAQNPILQGIIAGGAYGAGKGDALYGLGKGVEWAQNKQNTNNYRDALASEGIYVNPGIFGSMSSTDYSNYARGPLRQAMTDVYKERAKGEALENQNAQEMSGLTVGDYLNGAVLSGRFKDQQAMLDWAAANNIDLNGKYYPELQTQLLNEFKEKNKYGANKTAQEKVELLKQGKPTQITEFRNIKSGGSNDTQRVIHEYPNGNPYQKGGNSNSKNGGGNNVSQNGTIIVNPKTGERMKLINGKWERI